MPDKDVCAEFDGAKAEPIYLDHNATTPVGGRVLEKMLPYFCEVYGNAASIDHIHEDRAKQAVDAARQAIAKVLGCRKESEIIFTSGATEANNLALIGAFRKFLTAGTQTCWVTVQKDAEYMAASRGVQGAATGMYVGVSAFPCMGVADSR